MKVAIIDYKLSNLFSVKNACELIGAEANITSSKDVIQKADAVILPGVGTFGDAMKNLRELDLINVIKDSITLSKPFMGVCLGLQLLFSESEEFGLHKGLDIIAGKVKRFSNQTKSGEKIKVPQISWNRIYRAKSNAWRFSPLRNVKNGEFMYFVHSYYAAPIDKKIVLATAHYADIDYCCSILYKNIFAVQFHPEKSASVGIKIYKDWLTSL